MMGHSSSPRVLPPVDRLWTLFLDRDGVINRRIPNGYVTSVEQLELLPGVASAIARLNNLFQLTVVVTNQRAVALGLMSIADLHAIHLHLAEQLRRAGARIDAFIFCPHNQQDQCSCRKPRTGMLLKATILFPQIKLHKSIVVGDHPRDILMGLRAGCWTVAVGNLNAGTIQPHLKVDSLAHLAEILTA